MGNSPIEKLKSIVDVVHEEDCPIFIQIHHAGVVGISEDPICPSPYEYKGFNRSVILKSSIMNIGY